MATRFPMRQMRRCRSDTKCRFKGATHATYRQRCISGWPPPSRLRLLHLLSSARRTDAVEGIRWAYRRLAWAERQRLRRQVEFQRRRRETIKRSITAGDWIPAEEVIETLRAKVDAARARRVIGVLRGKLDVPANFDDPLPEEVLQDFEGRLTTDTELTVTTRTKDDDPGFVEALLNEAIELAANGEPELAKRVLRDLAVGTKRRAVLYRSGEK